MPYHYKPHAHVKIWISNNPAVFMNFENQTRLIRMRESCMQDPINLIYDSSVLNDNALKELHAFCQENNITPVDAHTFHSKLESNDERTLYQFYKDEVNNLQKGGNLGVASDILRWLSASYRLGTYTDLDVPLNTHHVPESILVNAPLLLNIGSLKLLGSQEMVLALNEYIAVVDEHAAKKEIQKVHADLIKKLSNYSSDYIEKTEEMLSQGNWFNRLLVGSMKSRAEAVYIKKASALNLPDGVVRTSRNLRAYVNEVMTHAAKYLDFHRVANEPDKEIIQRLRSELHEQLGLVKWLFFRKEYNDITKALALHDDQFISYMMKKERSLYLKSIVVCTTGPIEVGRSLFGNYVLSSEKVNDTVSPMAFSEYHLQKAFLSNNVIPLHENPVSMLSFLGADVGALNDSSWLDEGISLQKKREMFLIHRQRELMHDLPSKLDTIKMKINAHIKKLEDESNGLFSFIGKKRREIKLNAMKKILTCFNEEQNIFNGAALKSMLTDNSLNWKEVFAGTFSHRTETLVKELQQLYHDAVRLRVIRDREKLIRLKSAVTQEQNEESVLMYNPLNQLVRNKKRVSEPKETFNVYEMEQDESRDKMRDKVKLNSTLFYDDTEATEPRLGMFRMN